ncbi:MAG TPA: hypothetical protein ENK80_02845 [Rhodobacterales bacterium]|nr:hypothetical protein [Rhodobacterales bacterium]
MIRRETISRACVSLAPSASISATRASGLSIAAFLFITGLCIIARIKGRMGARHK